MAKIATQTLLMFSMRSMKNSSTVGPLIEVAMANIKEKINSQLQDNILIDFCITSGEIVKTVQALKQEKADGDRGCMSNHLLGSSHLYFESLAKLLTAMYIRGYYAEPLLNASIVSIPKDYKSLLVEQITRSIVQKMKEA